MSELELSNNPNVDTGFVTDGNQKNKVQLVAQLDASGIELPSSPNSDSAYVTINGKKHKVKLTAVLYGGGTSEIIHDDTLSGSGTAESPLKVADGTYLPLSGGTLTGAINFDSGYSGAPTIGFAGQNLVFFGTGENYGTGGVRIIKNAIYARSGLTIGVSGKLCECVYTKKLNNGADLAVPTEGGTLARVEDINAAVGDIASVLDAINGESV